MLRKIDKIVFIKKGHNSYLMKLLKNNRNKIVKSIFSLHNKLSMLTNTNLFDLMKVNEIVNLVIVILLANVTNKRHAWIQIVMILLVSLQLITIQWKLLQVSKIGMQLVHITENKSK